ncbi:MAG: DUF3256 family protein [Muribaculaceae bacterium]|nr:DUF3256 family protein [Muribaculaceae bacterium]
MKKILTILMALSAVLAGARTVADFFVAAPMYEAAPYLDANMRLDLLDYFRSGLPSRTTNVFDENASVTYESERALTVNVATGVVMQYGLAVSGQDSVLVVIETLPLPMADSRVTLYDTDWNPIRRQPLLTLTLDDWLSADGRAQRGRVEEILPFVTAEANFDADGNRILFTNTVGGYFADSDSTRAEVSRYLKPSLSYRFDGRNFKLEK